MGAENGNARMAEELRRLADALSRLVKQHFDLARAELKQDASRWGRDAAVGLAALPFAILGLLLLDLAVASLLARAIGTPGALAVIGAANLGISGALGLLAVRRIRARSVALRGTAEELRIDREVLRAVGRGESPTNGHPGHRPPEAQPRRPVLPGVAAARHDGPPPAEVP